MLLLSVITFVITRVSYHSRNANRYTVFKVRYHIDRGDDGP
nr:MAG TPA: hypothetical protein [Caudoviricetes sp.]